MGDTVTLLPAQHVAPSLTPDICLRCRLPLTEGCFVNNVGLNICDEVRLPKRKGILSVEIYGASIYVPFNGCFRLAVKRAGQTRQKEAY